MSVDTDWQLLQMLCLRMQGRVCRKVFEPFGGMKSAVIAARDNEPGDTRLKLAGFNGDQMTSDPDYDQPLVKELELVLVVFDILYCRGQVPYSLSHFWRWQLRSSMAWPSSPLTSRQAKHILTCLTHA